MIVKKFSETQPKNEQEDDRQQLKVGDKFTVTGFVIQPSERFKDGICKINGLSLKDGTVVKYWTTGQAVHTQLMNMANSVGIDSGALKTNVGVQVYEKKSATGRMYLTLGDIE
jgi:hypothetical protein